MVSTTIAFSMNDTRLTQLKGLQKERKRGAISTDLFAKELLYERIDALLNEAKK